MDLNRLAIYDTSRFAIDPKDNKFFEKMGKYPEMELKSTGVDRGKYLVYITLMYDKHSDIRLNKELTYWQKKKTAALAAGFKLKNNTFDPFVESCLLSENEEVLGAMMRYLQLQYMPEFTQLCLYSMLHDVIWRGAILKQETNLLKPANDITVKVTELEEKVFGGKELIKAKEALYQKIGKLDLGIRAEDVAKKMENNESFSDWSKFGDYVPDQLEFAGDEIPGS